MVVQVGINGFGRIGRIVSDSLRLLSNFKY